MDQNEIIIIGNSPYLILETIQYKKCWILWFNGKKERIIKNDDNTYFFWRPLSKMPEPKIFYLDFDYGSMAAQTSTPNTDTHSAPDTSVQESITEVSHTTTH